MPAPSIHGFAEKVALVTDGASAIGRAVALQLALQGSYVIVAYAKEDGDAAARAIGELKNLGTLASAFEIDLSNADGAKKLVSEVEQLFGRIDLLVNCVKTPNNLPFEDTSEEFFDQFLSKNLKSAFFVTRESLKLMKTRPKPKIVNVVSALDTDQTARNVLFASVQASLVGLTEALAASLPEKFRVNAVAVSEKQSAAAETLDAELFRPKTGVSEDDVARTILFLLSSEAIGLNGQTLKIR